jgi:hypothetical protein
MASRRGIPHVWPDRGWWKRTTDSETIMHCAKKTRAIHRGRQLARANLPSQLLIHDLDGKIEDESTHQGHPVPPCGQTPKG